MRKKILFISNVDWFFLSHRLPIGLEAISQGYEVHLATKFTKNEKFFLKKGFIVHHLEMHRTQINIFKLLKNFITILMIIKKIKPNLVHAITIKPVILGGIATRICGDLPFVASISGLGYVFTSRGIIPTLIKGTIKNLYNFAFSNRNIKVIFQNLDDKKIVQKFCNLKNYDSVLIKGSGIDLDIYKPSLDNNLSKKVLFASRLLKSKGIIEFAKSALILKGENYEFLIAGKLDKDNPDCISENLLMEWHSKGIIKFLGHQKNIYELINQSKIVVLPSYYGEGLPKILIEAAACGKPVITTDHPGCRDAIIPNVTGLLVPVKDSDALSKAINKLIKNDQLCKQMGDSGRELALKRYDIKEVVKKHFQIYSQLIENFKKS